MNRTLSGLAAIALVALSGAAPSAGADSARDPVITEARANDANTILQVVGTDLSGGAPRLTLGTQAAPLVVTLATSTRIEALLPPGVPPGTYLLTLTIGKYRDRKSSDSEGPRGDEFWVTLGAQGPSGPQGIAGPAGATGQQGLAGPPGPAGPQGVAGATGPAGLQGPPGTAGAMGLQGPAGSPGAAGKEGSIGPQGMPGKDGMDGPIGPAGPQGPPGPGGGGTSVPSLESLAGVSCNVGTLCQGVTVVRFDEATFGIALRCVPPVQRVLTVNIAPGHGGNYTVDTSPAAINAAPLYYVNSIPVTPGITQVSGAFCPGASVHLTIVGGTIHSRATGDCQGAFSSSGVAGKGFQFECDLAMDANKTVTIGS